MQWNLSGKQDVYLDIADKFEHYIHVGVYQSGEKLPSVRTAAKDFGVNPNTVARAYAVLEERGIIRTLPKKGVFVMPRDETDSPVPEAQLRQTVSDWRAMGVSLSTLTKLLKEVYEDNDSDT